LGGRVYITSKDKELVLVVETEVDFPALGKRRVREEVPIESTVVFSEPVTVFGLKAVRENGIVKRIEFLLEAVRAKKPVKVFEFDREKEARARKRLILEREAFRDSL